MQYSTAYLPAYSDTVSITVCGEHCAVHVRLCARAPMLSLKKKRHLGAADATSAETEAAVLHCCAHGLVDHGRDQDFKVGHDLKVD